MLVLSFAVSRVQTSTRVLTFADPPLVILIYPCISRLRWYLHSGLEDDHVNSADSYTANISTFTVRHLQSSGSLRAEKDGHILDNLVAQC